MNPGGASLCVPKIRQQSERASEAAKFKRVQTTNNTIQYVTHRSVVDADIVCALGCRCAAIFYHDAVPARIVRVRECPENTVIE